VQIVTVDRPAGPRPRVRVSGAVDRVRASGPGGPPMLRAELGGGPERITIVWLGRDSIPGIEPGRMLAVEGTLSRQGGRRVMYNPRYDLGPGPAPR
jgi:hypothetical protein